MEYQLSSVSDVPKRNDKLAEIMYRADAVFLGDSVEEFIELAKEKNEQVWVNRMSKFSPTSMKVRRHRPSDPLYLNAFC
jgi:hypothetical protein